MRIGVRVTANSRQAQVLKTGADRYSVKVNAPADKGRANARLVEIMSDYFEVPKSRIRIISGLKSREKSVDVLL